MDGLLHAPNYFTPYYAYAVGILANFVTYGTVKIPFILFSLTNQLKK
jgi:hypothetical protein